MKKRGLVIGLLIMLALVTSGFTYAFWASAQLDDDYQGTVTIGQGREATVTVGLDAVGSGTLVPSGQVANSVSASPVTSIVFTFDVDYVDNMFTGDAATITFSVDNISNATAETYLVFTFTGGTSSTITEGSTLSVTLTVTLTEPANQTDYNAIKNAAVTFDVNFVVTDLQV